MLNRNKGFGLTEIIISIVVFLIGVIALIGSIAFSLNSVIRSKEALAEDMTLANSAEEDLLTLIADPGSYSPSGNNKKVSDLTLTLTPTSADKDTVGEIKVDMELYRYSSENKYGTYFYLLKNREQ